MKNIICLLCGKNQQLKELYPSTFQHDELNAATYSARRTPDKVHFRIVQCQRCGLIFSSPILPPEKISSLYENSSCNYQEQIPYLTQTYLDIVQKVSKNLPHKPKVLEVGCGTGFFLHALKKGIGADVFGVEPSLPMVHQAHPSIKKHIVTDIFKPGQFPPNDFDIVCCFHTLDHLVDPGEFVKETLKILKKGGSAIVVVHDTEGLSVKLFGERSPIFDVEHIYLFNKPTLARLFGQYGFDASETFNVVNTYPLHYWLKMSGIPNALKTLGLRFLNMTKIGDRSFSLAGGNIGIIAQKAK